ncbi:MAG: MFS transporter [Gammaproteobacteria bacterium]|nr:MFS transporter [Gammaproteobacteria bacterium]
MQQDSTASSTLVLRIYLPFALGYFLSYVFRVVNAVIAGDLRTDLELDSSVLGLLTSTYFLTFAAFQLPLGYLLDRFGPRRVEASLLLIAALGAFVFSLSESVAGLIAGRALIGLGVSACLMAAFKAYVDWFPSDRLPRINGWQMAAGGLGALFATRPVEMSLPVLGWQGVFQILGVACIAAAVIMFLVVPEREKPAVPEDGEETFGFKTVFTSPLFLRVAPLTMTSQASFLSVSGLWAGTWLQDVAGMDRAPAANVLAGLTVAMIAGFVVLGSITSELSRKGISTFTTATVSVVAATIPLLWMIVSEGDAPAWLCWTMFGFFGTGSILYYAALSQHFPRQIAGRVNTAMNLLVFVGAFLLQWGIGVVIDHWSGGDGFSVTGYRVAFSVLVALQGLALLWYLLFRRNAAGVRQQ